MKRFSAIVTLTFCSVLFAVETEAQTWRRVATKPVITNLTSVHMLNAQQLFVTGEDDTLIRSNDGGNSWTKVNLPIWPADPLYRVKFRDANVGFVTGNNENLFRTTDGGATWNRVPGYEGGSSWHISFPAPDVVFVGANGSIARSLDNGATVEVRSGWPTCPVIYGMDFRDASVGIVGGNIAEKAEAGIYKTTDGGETWVRKYSAPANQVIWVNSTTVLALTYGQVVKSTDEGETWSVHASAPPMVTMQRVTPSLFVGVDAVGGIYRSTDGAQSWQTVQEPIFDLSAAWEVHFADAQNGFVVGERGSLFRTTDGGATWQQRNNGINMQSADIHAFSDDVLLSAGDIGLIMRSTDGGNWWSVQRIKVTGVIWNRYEDIRTMDIHAPSGLAIAAGAGGVIFRSTDRGATWQSVGYPAVSPNDPPTFHKVHVVNASVAYLITQIGGVWKTVDGGLTWSSSAISGAELYDVEFVDENNGYVVGSDQTAWQGARLGYYRTTNGGASWTFHEVSTPHSSLHTMKMANASVGYLMGAGYVAKTVNGGQTWTPTSIGPDRLWNTLYVRSATEVYAAESGYENPEPKLWKSTDGGQTWAFNSAGEPPLHLDAITMTPGGALFVAGFQGNVWTTAPAGQPQPLQLVSAVSRKTHGSVGTFDIHLPLAGEPAVECRNSGGAHTLIFTFDREIASGTAQVASGSRGTAGSPVFSGNTMTVHLTAVEDAQTFTLTLADVTGTDGASLPNAAVSLHVLGGDTNGNKVVNATDIAQTKASAGQPVTTANFRMDSIPNGSINSSDVGFVKSVAGSSISAAPTAGRELQRR